MNIYAMVRSQFMKNNKSFFFLLLLNDTTKSKSTNLNSLDYIFILLLVV